MDCGGGKIVGWVEVMVIITVVYGAVVGAAELYGGSKNVEEDVGMTGGGGDDCNGGATREVGKDCEKRGEEAGRLEARYDVSKVVAPGVEPGGVYTEVLWLGIPTENELEGRVGRMVKGGLVTDVTLSTVLPEGKTKVVLWTPKETEYEASVGEETDALVDTITLPLVFRETAETTVLGGE